MIKQGKIVDGSVEEDDEDIESDEKKEEGSGFESELVEDEGIEKERSHITTVLSVAVNGINVVKDAVAYDRDWYPGQFVKFEEQQEEMQIHFAHRSSSNCYLFVWPELPNDVPDISWVSEGE